MKLYVMRHGPAEDFAASGRDYDRALTLQGRKRVASVVTELAKRDELPRVILSSPLVRALQTAEHVAQRCPVLDDAVTAHQEIAPGGSLRSFVFQQLQAGRRRLMVVGHEPDVSSLVAHYLPSRWAEGMEKAMVVGLRLHPGAPAEFRFVLEPRTLNFRTE